MLTLVILFSMVLHCASRLGILSHVYKQRHEIAFALGLIDEIPIALCSEADFANGATLLISNDHHESTPSYFNHAAEIVLYCAEHQHYGVVPYFDFQADAFTPCFVKPYDAERQSIFHPPLVG